MNRIFSIAKKETYHILRDPFTLALAIALPMVMILLFGSAIEFNPKDAATAYLDSDRTTSSRKIVETLGSSNYFKMFPVSSSQEGMQALESGKAKAFLAIPPQFEKAVKSNREISLQMLVDGSDNAFAGILSSYLRDMHERIRFAVTERAFKPSVRIESRFIFNPELNSKWFAVPGLAVVIMSIVAILLTTLTVAREWELGSMELLLSTPVRPVEIITGKLAPYAALGMLGASIVYVMARTIFHVPFVGNHAILFLGSLLFLCTYLAQGLLISVVTKKQMLAMQLGIMSGLLPSQLLSGFIFPIENMPVFFRYFTAILPARWYMVIIRDQFLKGSSMWDLVQPFLALATIMLVFVFLAKRKFKRSLE